MLRVFGIIALCSTALLLCSYYAPFNPGGDDQQDQTQQQANPNFDENQGVDPYEQYESPDQLNPLPPPNSYIRGEKGDIKRNIGRQGVGQIRIRDRSDSRTKKERTMGPSLPLVPNKGS